MGKRSRLTRRVPPGTAEACERRGRVQRKHSLSCEILSPLSGLRTASESLDPPLKRWAIVGCPSRDKEGPVVAFRLGEACDFPAFHTLETLRWRTETLRRIATALLRKTRGSVFAGRSPSGQWREDYFCPAVSSWGHVDTSHSTLRERVGRDPSFFLVECEARPRNTVGSIGATRHSAASQERRLHENHGHRSIRASGDSAAFAAEKRGP